jgi:cytochrome c
MSPTHLVMSAFVLVCAAHVAKAQNATAGQGVFKSQCSICHSVQAGRNLNGPSLDGVVGRKAGSVPGYHYSAANKSSGLTWNAATLDRYLAAPREVVPGTLMSYQGLHDPQKRSDLIAYLATLS